MKAEVKKAEKQEKSSNIFDYYKDRGYTKEQFEYAISKLTEGSLQEYKKWFDDEGKRINCSAYSRKIMKILYTTIPSIIKREIKKDNTIEEETHVVIADKNEIENNVITDFSEYIKSLTKMKLFTKENISLLEISDKSAFYLYLIFDLNENCTYTIEEMAEYLNIDLNTFINEIKEAIKEAKDKIDIRVNKVCDCIKKALD